MSAKNITSPQNKPDPSINSRVYNSLVDGALTVTGTATFNGGEVTSTDIPVTILATGINKTPQTVTLHARKVFGIVTMRLPPFTIASADQNSTGTITLSALPAEFRPAISSGTQIWTPVPTFRIPSQVQKVTILMNINASTGVITFSLNNDGGSFTGGGTDRPAGPNENFYFTYSTV